MTYARSARRPTLFACVAFALLHVASANAAPAAKKPAEAPATLKFSEIFKQPIGPKGLEPTDAVRALDGRRVRIVGYVVEQENAASGMILSPLPVLLGDEDEGLADDLPPTAISVIPASKKPLPKVAGLVEVTGTLALGAHEDAATGRVMSLRLVAEPRAVKPLRLPKAAESPKPAAPARAGKSPHVESP